MPRAASCRARGFFCGFFPHLLHPIPHFPINNTFVNLLIMSCQTNTHKFGT